MRKKVLLSTLLFFFVLSLFSTKAFLSWKQTKNLNALKIKAPEVKITIIEGWSINDIADSLENKGYIKRPLFKSALGTIDISKYPLLQSLPKNSSLEGYLFPDTYSVYEPKKEAPETFAKELAQKALTNFENKFTSEMEKQAKALKLSVHNVVTLASIIEKETGRNSISDEQKQKLDEERKIISGIFHNRLTTGMALESDATINYVTGKNNPTPTLNELAANSPYNTYKNKGLPPGPICNPSLSSLMAALYPNKTDYFYFLHKQPSGEAVYSKTYEEHLSNKYKYLK